MSKWQPLYKCLLCGRVMAYKDALDFPDEKAGAFASWFGNHANTMERAREHIPMSVSHDCYGHGRNVGVAVFCGFYKETEDKNGDVAEEGEHDGPVPRE